MGTDLTAKLSNAWNSTSSYVGKQRAATATKFAAHVDKVATNLLTAPGDQVATARPVGLKNQSLAYAKSAAKATFGLNPSKSLEANVKNGQWGAVLRDRETASHHRIASAIRAPIAPLAGAIIGAIAGGGVGAKGGVGAGFGIAAYDARKVMKSTTNRAVAGVVLERQGFGKLVKLVDNFKRPMSSYNPVRFGIKKNASVEIAHYLVKLGHNQHIDAEAAKGVDAGQKFSDADMGRSLLLAQTKLAKQKDTVDTVRSALKVVANAVDKTNHGAAAADQVRLNLASLGQAFDHFRAEGPQIQHLMGRLNPAPVVTPGTELNNQTAQEQAA